MDAEPVTPDAFLGSQIPELPPELRILRIRACADCTPPARSMPAPAPASNRSARGTHPWPIRHPPRLAFRVPFAVTRSTPPPKGNRSPRPCPVPKPDRSVPATPKDNGFRPALVSNSWPARAWIYETLRPLRCPCPPERTWGAARPPKVRRAWKGRWLTQRNLPPEHPATAAFRRSACSQSPRSRPRPDVGFPQPGRGTGADILRGDRPRRATSTRRLSSAPRSALRHHRGYGTRQSSAPAIPRDRSRAWSGHFAKRLAAPDDCPPARQCVHGHVPKTPPKRQSAIARQRQNSVQNSAGRSQLLHRFSTSSRHAGRCARKSHLLSNAVTLTKRWAGV